MPDNITFKLSSDNELSGKLVIYNLVGEVIIEENFNQNNGQHEFVFTDSDFQNQKGIYIYKIIANSETLETGKIIMH